MDRRTVKVSYSGATYAELYNTVERALRSNPELKTVLFCIDEWFLYAGRNMILADGEYPTYLYDGALINDVEYVLNKEVFCSNTLGVLEFTAAGNVTTSFDEYGSWVYPYSKDAVMAQYSRPETTAEPQPLSQKQADTLVENLRSTALVLAEQYPATEFIYYFPPYSILDWDNNQRQGTLEQHVEAFRLASSILLDADNIRLFSFYTDYATITDLNNYRDTVHHSDAINSLLLTRIAAGEYELTRETYETHWQEVLDYYSTFDYDSLFLP